jgi:RNA polymerase sigma factor for flagellar operon FliA
MTMSSEADIHARIRENLDLCDAVARQLRSHVGSNVPQDELVAIGREALTLAARSFDPSLGVPFRRYASLRVRGGVIDGVRQRGPLPRRVYRALRAVESADAVQEAMVQDDAGAPSPGQATAEAADAKISDYLSKAATAMAASLLSMRSLDEGLETADDAASPEEKLAHAQMLAKMREAVAELGEQERTLVQRYYFEDKTLLEVGKELGLSKSWTCRLHARVVEAIAKKLGAR